MKVQDKAMNDENFQDKLMNDKNFRQRPDIAINDVNSEQSDLKDILKEFWLLFYNFYRK